MTKNVFSGSQLDDSLFMFDDNTPEEDGESATRNRQAKSKAGHKNDPKRITGIEKEISKSNTKSNNHASAKDAGSSRARKGTPCDSTRIDDISFMFDDHTTEKDSAGRHQKKELDSGKNYATSDKDASSDGDTGIDSDSESKGKKEMIVPKLKGKRKAIIPKTSVSTRNAPKLSCSLTKASCLSSHKSQKGKLSTSDEISAQKIVSGKKARSARLKATVDDIAHFVSGQQEDNLTQALSKVGLGSKNAAPRKRGREREASKTGIKNSGLTNGKTHLRDNAEKRALMLEGENPKLSSNKVRSGRVKTRENNKDDPTIPLFEPRITRAMKKLVQDKENKTTSTKLRGKISSGVKGASNTSQDSQLEHTLSDGDFPKTVSDYADITDELHLDSSMFSFHDIVDGEKLIATEKGQIMDGEPIIIESEYIVLTRSICFICSCTN